jgi:peptidoglycan L-alanyl-D-glutamate endopeptidase CwlK
MKYSLSQRSLSRLEGVDEDLVKVVKFAIGMTSTDFGVTEGLRTIARQEELVNKGASKTMKSMHIIGRAVDLVAYDNGNVVWELPFYFDIADAMKEAAVMVDVPLQWGAAWHIEDIRKFDGSMKDAYNAYVDKRRSQGRTPFIDAPHFQI